MKWIFIVSLLVSTAFAKPYKSITLTDSNHINFNKSFTGFSVALKQLELMNLVAASDADEFYIVLHSPGGSVSAGQLFIDTIKGLNVKVHTITIFAASMAYNLVQSLGKRYILPSGILMSHRAYLGGLSGQFPGELNKRLGMYMGLTRGMAKSAAARIGLETEDYEKLIHDELWLTGEEAVKSNHADEIVTAKCDKTLLKTTKENVQTIFGEVTVKFSKCPLITTPISVEGDNRAKGLFLRQRNLNLNSGIQTFL